MSESDSLSAWLGGGGSDEAAGVEAEAALARLRRGMFSVADATVSMGRYRDLEEIGRGGMSVVYRGHDGEIGRTVAIKVLRGDRSGQEQRLRREARAMARLSHPNVVQVLEVGRHRDETYVVMELVEGRDAAQWLSEEPRGWQEVLDVFLAAGEGLVAAHGEGLVHRDFKPSNVLVGDDGRVRVTDFGLAASGGQTPLASDTAPSLDEGAALSSLGDDDAARTATGALLGTPRYMAPEQRFGARVDHRADQWSFAASLWESLYGQHPLIDQGGQLDPSRTSPVRPAAERGVPRAIARVLRRSLEVEPNHRYRGMRELLAALRAASRGRGRRLAQAAAGLVVAGGLTWWAAGAASEPASHCDPAEHSAAAWSAERRAAIERAFVATELPYATQALADVEARVGPWIEAWDEEYRGACEAAAGAPLAPETELRLACLRAELTEVDEMLAAFATADRALVGRAEAATRSLPEHQRCRSLNTREDVEPGVLAAHEERMARIHGSVRAGRYREAAAAAAEALEQTTEPVLRAEVLLSRGLNLRRSGDFDGALEPMREAFERAASSGDAKVAARAAIALLQLSTARSEYEETTIWIRHVRTWIARLDDPKDRERLQRELDLSEAGLLHEQGRYDDAIARLDRVWDGCQHDESLDFVPRMFNQMGLAHMQRGTYDDAAKWFERAGALESERSGDQHPQVAASMENLGSVEWYRGNYDVAEQRYRQTLAIREATLGPDNAKTANTVMNLGIIAHVRGDHEGAEKTLQEAVDSFTRIVGRDHPSTALALGNLAATLSERGEYERSNRANREALEIYEAVYGPDHPMVGNALHNLASGLIDVERYEEALEMGQRALEILGNGQGRPPLNYGLALHNAAVALRRLERYEEAETYDREALAVYESAMGPDHPEIALVLTGLADNALRDERWDDVVALCERARSLEPALAHLRGLVAFFEAQARWEQRPRDRARVQALIDEGRRELADAGRNGADNLEALERWAAENRL